MAKYRKLSRTSSQRKALLRGQVTALLNNGKIVTTEATPKLGGTELVPAITALPNVFAVEEM